ncbi:conserved hypothetical protein [Tenacibaculum maritimum]|uniref:hypothetical protein n=1 Tax=Tenacibaculum maritimum TaxID=107401 RepID=UPI0012E668CB|nr:hypothetical protein [Tenacibaculum maritimum]CAA0160023.1 conserved hypothetical protein [Tenacibaculum maritimum]
MNKELINRVLIVLVVFIWGLVLYKFFVKKKNENIEKRLEINREHFVENNKVREKSLKLFYPVKDPFLGIIEKKRSKVVKKMKKNQKLKKMIAWPPIKYLGFLKKKHREELVLLKVKGKFVKMKKGKKHKKYKFYVKDIYRDSILLRQELESKIVKK